MPEVSNLGLMAKFPRATAFAVKRSSFTGLAMRYDS